MGVSTLLTTWRQLLKFTAGQALYLAALPQAEHSVESAEGLIISWPVPWRPAVVAYSPEAFQKVLKLGPEQFWRRKPYLPDELMGAALLFSDGLPHIRGRRALMDAIFKSRGERETVLRRHTRRLVASIRSLRGDAFDIVPVISTSVIGLVADATCGAGLDELVSGDAGRPLRESIEQACDMMVAAMVAPPSDMLPRKAWLNLTSDGHIFQAICKDVRRAVQAAIKVASGQDGSKQRMTLLSCMLKGSGRGVEEIVDELTASIVHQCSSITSVVAWTLREILDHRDVMNKAVREASKIKRVEETIGSKYRDGGAPNRPPLAFLDECIKESCRIHPPLPALPARVLEEEVKVNGVKLPRGTTIELFVDALHKSKFLWRRSPREFDPSRHSLIGGATPNLIRPFCFLPFGGGESACPMAAAGMDECRALLWTVLHSFSIEDDPRSEERIAAMQPRDSLTLPPRGVVVRCTTPKR
eukprot:g140.t1